MVSIYDTVSRIKIFDSGMAGHETGLYLAAN